MQKQRAQEILDAFAGKRVLVVGDVMLDEYVWGRVSRVSPEAPVMVVDADHHTYVPGGAANVVNNLCALGAKAAIAGLVGKDGAGQTLTEKLTEEGATSPGLLRRRRGPPRRRPASSPTRSRSCAWTTRSATRSSREEQARLLDYLDAAIPACDALLLSDYQKGLLGRELIQKAVATARRARQGHHGQPQAAGHRRRTAA